MQKFLQVKEGVVTLCGRTSGVASFPQNPKTEVPPAPGCYSLQQASPTTALSRVHVCIYKGSAVSIYNHI